MYIDIIININEQINIDDKEKVNKSKIFVDGKQLCVDILRRNELFAALLQYARPPFSLLRNEFRKFIS